MSLLNNCNFLVRKADRPADNAGCKQPAAALYASILTSKITIIHQAKC